MAGAGGKQPPSPRHSSGYWGDLTGYFELAAAATGFTRITKNSRLILPTAEDAGDHAAEHRNAEQPPVPFHAERLMRGLAELAGDEGVVIEIGVRQIEAVVGFILLPGFFLRRGYFFGTARTRFADADLSVAKGTKVAQNFRHPSVNERSAKFRVRASLKNRLAFGR